MRKRTVYNWRREVFRSPVSANVRLLLVYMFDEVKERDMRVSIPRTKMAKALGWSEQRVSERLSEAVKLGFLGPVSPGYRGHTAVYQAMFPDVPIAKSVRKNRTLPRDQKHGRFAAPKRPEDTDTTSRANPAVGPTRRDIGIDERPEDQPARASVTGCRWHDETHPCPEDCANHPHTRRRTA